MKKTVALLLCAALLFSAFGGSALAALRGDNSFPTSKDL